jgi:hypothetical protein
MKVQKFRTLLQRQNIIPATVLLLSLAVITLGVASGGAQSQQDKTTSDERQINNTVPDHVPVRVKLKNEQSFKDKNNKNWAREMEIEVKNIGDKPIYYVHVEIVMPEINVGGPLVFMAAYGRKELAFPDELPTPNDVPLLPGESVTLKIPEGQLRGYEKARDEERQWDDPKKIEIEVNAVKFGDGTSFMGRKGNLQHAKPKKQSENNQSPKSDAGGCKSVTEVLGLNVTNIFLKGIYSLQPATFLRANFFSARSGYNFNSDCCA